MNESIAHPIIELNGVDVTHRECNGAVMRMHKQDTLREKHQVPYRTINTLMLMHKDYLKP